MLKRSVNRWLEKAKEAEARGGTRDAERIIEQILTIYPTHVGARLVRARCWARRGCLECAIKEFDMLLESDTEQLEVRMSLAAALILVGDYEKGVDQLALAARQCAWQDGNELSYASLDSSPAV